MFRDLIVWVTAFLVLTAGNLFGWEQYKKYEVQKSEELFLKISPAKRNVVMTAYGGDTSETYIFSRNEARKNQKQIFLDDRPVLNEEGVLIAGSVYPLNDISRTEVKNNRGEESKIYFYKNSGSDSTSFRRRNNNIISVMDDIYVPRDQFVRGSVVGFWSNIAADGEINEDVIAVYGNITVGDGAVIRGSVIAINGRVEASRGATIYGEVQASDVDQKYRFDRWRHWYRRDREFYPIGEFHYNRVDGATPFLGLGFKDEDSLLPSIELYAGYGLSSERWRYWVSVEQSFFRSRPVTVGGALFRRLGSPDDWIISDEENTAFALIATEDYKDYYETQGGTAFIRFAPYRALSMEIGMLGENYRWLDAHRNLWSLFGGSKRFPENFYAVPYEERLAAIKKINKSELTSLRFKSDFSTDDREKPYKYSRLWGSVELEWTPGEWNSDYLFTRYFARIGRYQVLNKHTGLILSLTYGGADRELPIQRRFYLGGMGTIHGYSYKEFMGSEFWLGDIEYRISFPQSSFVGWLFYNAGQIAVVPGEWRDSEVKQSIGIGLSYEDNLRLNLARRLDQSDSSFKLTVSLKAYF
jgi:hypothetical protein